MKSTPNRFGNVPGAVVSPKAGRDSSHGSAIATPAPRRIVRREIGAVDFLVRFDMLFTFLLWGFDSSFIQELWTGHDGFDEGPDTVTIRNGDVPHLQHRRLVGKHQRP